MAKELPAALALTHRWATDPETASKKHRAELEARLAELDRTVAQAEKERTTLQTLLAHHPDSAPAAGLEMVELKDGWAVKK